MREVMPLATACDWCEREFSDAVKRRNARAAICNTCFMVRYKRYPELYTGAKRAEFRLELKKNESKRKAWDQEFKMTTRM